MYKVGVLPDTKFTGDYSKRYSKLLKKKKKNFVQKIEV